MRMATTGTLSSTMSFQAVVWVIFVGMATILWIGCLCLCPLSAYAAFAPDCSVPVLILLVGMVFVLIYMPEGLCVETE